MKKSVKQITTIQDIARLAKVSKTTVSRYLNKKYEFMSKETKEKIENIINTYNYTPSNVARSLKTKSTKLVGFVVSDIENAFAAPVIKTMNQALLNHKYHMIVCSSDNSVEQEFHLVESLIEQRVDAIFINPVSYNTDNFSQFKNKLPIILIDRGLKNGGYDEVSSDSAGSLDVLLDQLDKTNYSEIHLFSEVYDDVEPRVNKVEHFYDFMQRKGKTNILRDFVHVINHHDVLDIERKIESILNTSKGIPVIIATNGKTLLNVALAIKNLGLKMPSEIGLAGYDDFGVNSANGWTNIGTTSITSLCPNWKELGEEAVKLLMKRLLNPTDEKVSIKTSISLHLKDSTKLY